MEKTSLVLPIDLQVGELREIGFKIKGNGIIISRKAKELGRKKRQAFHRWT